MTIGLIVSLGNIAKLLGCIKASGFTVGWSGMEVTPRGKFVRVCFNLGENNSLFQHGRREIFRVIKPFGVCGRPIIFFHETAQPKESSFILAPK